MLAADNYQYHYALSHSDIVDYSKYLKGADLEDCVYIVEYALAKNYEICDIDGVRVEFDDAWMLIRATQTGPDVGMRFEAKTEERLKELMDEFRKVIDF